MSEREVFVHATNYDGTDHWRHPAWLVSATDELVVLRTEPGLVIQREAGRTWTDPWATRCFYWTDRWYNVIELTESGKGLVGFYCNVATPASFDGETLRYVDLQLDVRAYLEEDGSLRHVLLDEDEFIEACERYAYPEDVIRKARRAVDDLIALIEAGSFPFDAGLRGNPR